MTKRRRIYLITGKLASPIAIMGLHLYTLLTRRPRVRVMVENEKGEILLMLNVISRGNFWTFPGGGVNRGETLEAAARRELLEETGIDRPLSAFRFVRLFQRNEFNLPFDAPIFYVRARKDDLPKKLHNPREVAAVHWYKRDALPPRTAVFVKAVLAQDE